MLRGRAAGLVVLLLLTLVVPSPAASESSGAIEASAATVTVGDGSTLYAGDAVTITITFVNTQVSAATEVNWFVYKDGLNNLLDGNVVSLIEGGSSVDVQVTWNSITEGEHRVYVKFNQGGDADAIFNKAFTVNGLPDLRVAEAEVSPSNGLFSGDEATLSVRVLNAGSENASASLLGLQLGSTTLPSEDVPALAAGESAWVNTTFTAPGTGDHTLRVTPDVEASVREANEGSFLDVDFTVAPRMDVRHTGALSIEVDEGALNGPWTVSGAVERVAGTGTDTVPMRLEIIDEEGHLVPMAPFEVVLEGAGYATATWERTITSSEVSTLARGVSHNVVAVIDPFGTASFVQEDTSNDRSDAVQLDLDPIPDVYLDLNAIPESPSVDSGERVNWSVFMINTGTVTVRGTLEVTFDGLSYDDRIVLDGGESLTWYPNPHLPTTVGAHTAQFEARFEADSDSWDADPSNSVARGSVEVTAPLRLTWSASTLVLTNAEGDLVEPPLQPGATYVMTVNATSQETGAVNYTCDDGAGNEFETIPVSVLERTVSSSTVACSFVASQGQTTVRFVPSDPDVSTTFARTWASLDVADDGPSDEARSMRGLFRWASLFALLLVSVLITAWAITRARDEEVDRDIFEYCPSCDGELEGDEDTCPHCRFDLAKARKQFHNCTACGESVPDLLDNCPYCGTEQDVASYFERRERVQRAAPEKALQALPDDEEEDSDEIVSGSEDFADAVKAFGYNEDDLDDEWDTNIESAEAEVGAAQQRLDAEEVDPADLTPEELEALENSVTTTLRSVADSFAGQDIDSIIAGKGKGKVQALKDDGSELSASDAGIRERLFELTGEEGVLPGEEVKVGMSLTDGSLAGNEVGEATADFTFEDDNPASASVDDELTPKRAAPRRRAPRRAEAKPEPTVAQCGACGADIAVDATSCSTCGAVFE